VESDCYCLFFKDRAPIPALKHSSLTKAVVDPGRKKKVTIFRSFTQPLNFYTINSGFKEDSSSAAGMKISLGKSL